MKCTEKLKEQCRKPKALVAAAVVLARLKRASKTQNNIAVHVHWISTIRMHFRTNIFNFRIEHFLCMHFYIDVCENPSLMIFWSIFVYLQFLLKQINRKIDRPISISIWVLNDWNNSRTKTLIHDCYFMHLIWMLETVVGFSCSNYSVAYKFTLCILILNFQIWMKYISIHIIPLLLRI